MKPSCWLRHQDGRGLVWRAALLLYAVAAHGAAVATETAVAGVDDQFSELIARCAPTVHPQTMSAVISAESRGHQFAIADAGPVALPWTQRKAMVRSYYPDSLDAAVEKTSELVNGGHTVSIGLAQVNDRNLAQYGLTVRDVFDPCTNVAVGGHILTGFYKRATLQFGAGRRALDAAISAYNSGDWVRGAKDGYVGVVYKQVGRPLSMQTRAVESTTPASRAIKSKRMVVAAQTGRSFAMSASGFVVTQCVDPVLCKEDSAGAFGAQLRQGQ